MTITEDITSMYAPSRVFASPDEQRRWALAHDCASGSVPAIDRLVTQVGDAARRDHQDIVDGRLDSLDALERAEARMLAVLWAQTAAADTGDGWEQTRADEIARALREGTS